MTEQTALDLPAIRALHAGVTPGPWKWDGNIRRGLLNQATRQPVLQCSALQYPDPADAAFIAAAPSIVTQLLAVVERVEGLADELAKHPEHRNMSALFRAALNWKASDDGS